MRSLYATLLTLVFLTSTVIAAPMAAPSAIANPNSNSLHAPAHTLEARQIVDDTKFFVGPGTSIPESCNDEHGGLVKCKNLLRSHYESYERRATI